jgi:hypothetical protein
VPAWFTDGGISNFAIEVPADRGVTDRRPTARERTPTLLRSSGTSIRVWSIVWLLCTAVSGSAQDSPVDATGLGDGRYARMHMLLEKTIFKVDVLTLDVWLGTEEAARVEALADGNRFSKQLADSVAAVALDSRNAWARIEFKRDVSLDQFLGGIRDNLRRAVDAGIVTPAEYQALVADLPVWYAFLAEGRIRSGDEMFYRVKGDTLRTAYRSAEGDILLDQVDVGPERRLSVLGGYFALKSDFRDKLVESLIDRNR